ncbi:elongation factor G [Leptolyngbya sp. 15MV]|nr:elongation factor G [Leptolyngbya sp. 15MV]
MRWLLCGHAGSGKTSLVDRLLFTAASVAGAESGLHLKRCGSVDDGTSLSDFTDAEKHHKHSLSTKLFHFRFHGHEVNLIDSPGLGDFLGHAIAAMPAVETVAVVIDATRGIESSTRRLMQIAGERQIPRMIIVNKIDAPDVDLPGLVDRIREQVGSVCLPINLPAQGGKKVINVFDHDGTDAEGDAADFSSVHEAHKAIIEQIVEVEEDLMEIYLEKGEQFSAERLHRAFETCLEQAHLVPICFCSARSGVGAEDLLHVFADLCPSPVEVNPPEFLFRPVAPSGEPGDEQLFNPKPDPAGKVIAHVFKVAIDQHVGKLAYFRVHSGTVRHKQDLFLNDQKKSLRIGHLFKTHGKENIEVQELGPGDIGAVAKIEELHFNGVLHDSHEHDSVHLTPLQLPRPMYGLAVELKNHADENKFASACQRLQEEDPCFKIERVAATKQTVIRGLGELHLRIVLEKLKAQFNIDVLTSPPKTAYKETITAPSNGHHRHKKQTGGAGQFGEVSMHVEPNPGKGYEFAWAVVGGAISSSFQPSIDKGVQSVMSNGVIAGFPISSAPARRSRHRWRGR